MDAPIRRTQTFIDRVIFHEVKQLPDDHRFILRRHSGIRLVPATENAQPLELVTLDVQKFFSVGTALSAYSDGRYLPFLAPIFFSLLVFNGKAVTIPAGNVG